MLKLVKVAKRGPDKALANELSAAAAHRYHAGEERQIILWFGPNAYALQMDRSGAENLVRNVAAQIALPAELQPFMQKQSWAKKELVKDWLRQLAERTN